MRNGDVAILRGPDPYTVADDPATPPQVLIHPGQRCATPAGEDLHEAMDLGVRTWGNSPDGSTELLVGTYQMRGEISRRLLDALPALLVLPGDAWNSPLIPLLGDEIVRDEPGQEVVLDRLLDLLLIAVLRAWLSRPEAGAPAWYRAQSDPVVGRALHLLHDNPPTPGRWPLWPRRTVSPVRVGPPLCRAGGRAADGIPRRLAVDPRRRSAARARHHRRRCGPAGRLRQLVRTEQGIQAGARRQPARAPRMHVSDVRRARSASVTQDADFDQIAQARPDLSVLQVSTETRTQGE